MERKLGLTQEQLERRRYAIGGSDARCIMTGNAEQLLKLWGQKRGEVPYDNLETVLEARLGLLTEDLNVEWYERQTGRRVTHRQEERTSFDHTFMALTLDGLDDAHPTKPALYEAKHCSQWLNPEKAWEKYYAQVQHGMVVTGRKHAVLSCFFGCHDFEIIDVPLNEEYARELIEAERYFMKCVEDGVAPVKVEVKVPVFPIHKTDMTKEPCANMWGSAAADYLANKEAAETFEKAKADLKKMVPADAIQAFGNGILITRNKAGALTVKETP